VCVCAVAPALRLACNADTPNHTGFAVQVERTHQGRGQGRAAQGRAAAGPLAVAAAVVEATAGAAAAGRWGPWVQVQVQAGGLRVEGAGFRVSSVGHRV